MRKDDVNSKDDDLRPEYEDSVLKGVSAASIWIATAPGRTWRCWLPTFELRSRRTSQSTRHSGRSCKARRQTELARQRPRPSRRALP